MDADRAVEERARRRVAALDNVDVPSVRDLRDFEVQLLVRRGRRVVRRVMREAGMLRPWWERSPLLVLVVPLTLAYAAGRPAMKSATRLRFAFSSAHPPPP
ncbi:hypothetical protein [Demequina rhizosphaerae]|uniref:hypothetical protein n=1 Tax=Demequina rhizosphaerae TaxID=1638985 RepID=UPI000A07D0DD|nr:hypothetical protein [Demequina rhizosphaerae]